MGKLNFNLSFENLSYQVKDGFFGKSNQPKLVLKAISGEFRGGELSAIIGPSGGGKSSLLNALSGFTSSGVSGEIKINENPVSVRVVRKVSSYIMQENLLHDFLTVKEAMTFATIFKNERKMSEKKTIIESILSSLGMMKQLHTFVKHLSGGQQKRLSIAMELVDDPAILFLDEPTTGLDSSSSTQCIKVLKKLALEGKTIICTIHTPSALLFEMFDHVCTLADGSCIYQGASSNVVPFLAELDLQCPANFSPSDFLLEIATNDYGPQNKRLTTKIQNGSNREYRLEPNRRLNLTTFMPPSPSRSIYLLPFYRQVLHLLHRKFLINKRDKTLITMRLFIHLILGLMFGFLYRDCGLNASRSFDNYRYIITTVIVQLYTSYFSLQVASESHAC